MCCLHECSRPNQVCCKIDRGNIYHPPVYVSSNLDTYNVHDVSRSCCPPTLLFFPLCDYTDTPDTSCCFPMLMCLPDCAYTNAVATSWCPSVSLRIVVSELLFLPTTTSYIEPWYQGSGASPMRTLEQAFTSNTRCCRSVLIQAMTCCVVLAAPFVARVIMGSAWSRDRSRSHGVQDHRNVLLAAKTQLFTNLWLGLQANSTAIYCSKVNLKLSISSKVCLKSYDIWSNEFTGCNCIYHLLKKIQLGLWTKSTEL